jgi:hypothetical protein
MILLISASQVARITGVSHQLLAEACVILCRIRSATICQLQARDPGKASAVVEKQK